VQDVPSSPRLRRLKFSAASISWKCQENVMSSVMNGKCFHDEQ
jgi:hypothetical protein